MGEVGYAVGATHASAIASAQGQRDYAEATKKTQTFEEAKKHPNEWRFSGPAEGSDKADLSGIGGLLVGYFPPPKVPVNGQQSGGGIRVSTDALKAFAANLRLLIPALKKAQEQVASIKLLPGAFMDAAELTRKVVGVDAEGRVTNEKAIKRVTEKFLEKAVEAIMVAADETEKLAAAYATAEKLNAATGKDLGEHFERTKTQLGLVLGKGVS